MSSNNTIHSIEFAVHKSKIFHVDLYGPTYYAEDYFETEFPYISATNTTYGPADYAEDYFEIVE